ncbi:hypothetical protein ACFWWC_35280 [Streptomyces sp. NPDC058642]|uniref:hypothetical protein n=1 Tax=Streptomyces sp. NPDC058642 TaxID=3346572 RepID=UPI00364AC067
MRLPSAATPRVLGVDDFALYADVYGTLLVDADTRLPIDLWAGRDAEQLAAWLRMHPGVQVVCRDGAPLPSPALQDCLPFDILGEIPTAALWGQRWQNRRHSWRHTSAGGFDPRHFHKQDELH